jgi:hypothetical protein
VTGFPPVAALADEQLSTVRSFGQIAEAIFSLFQILVAHTKTKSRPRWSAFRFGADVARLEND